MGTVGGGGGNRKGWSESSYIIGYLVGSLNSLSSFAVSFSLKFFVYPRNLHPPRRKVFPL